MTATVWAVLLDDHRRDLLDLLRERPRAVGELVDALQLSQPMVSKHLRVLREAGFVQVAPVAQRRIYAIDPAPLAELDAWLRPYRSLWNDSLDALGRRLDATATQAATALTASMAPASQRQQRPARSRKES
jgi:DNA-binding transcriptional ArsR family regulator